MLTELSLTQIKPQNKTKYNKTIVFYSSSIFILLKQICIILRKTVNVDTHPYFKMCLL